MTYAMRALITKRVTVLIEADGPAEADDKFHRGCFDAEGGEVLAWEVDGEMELVDERREEGAA